MAEQPLFAGVDAAVGRGEKCADAFSLHQAYQYVWLATAGDNGGGTTQGGALGGAHFGIHAASADVAAGATGHFFQIGMFGGNIGD